MDSIDLRVKRMMRLILGHPVTNVMICLDKPKIYVHEEFETNKETEQVDLLKLICSVQVVNCWQISSNISLSRPLNLVKTFPSLLITFMA